MMISRLNEPFRSSSAGRRALMVAVMSALLVAGCASRPWPPASLEATRRAQEVTLTLEQGPLPDHVEAVVRALAVAAGEPALTVTSAARSPRRQVEVMLAYYVECADNPACSLAYMLEAYEPECLGRMAEHYREPEGRTPAETEAMLAAMTDEVAAAIAAEDAAHARGGPARACMAHVSAPGKFAVDVDPDPLQDPLALYKAARALGDRVLVQDRFFYPPIEGAPPSPTADAAFHLEVRDPPRFGLGSWLRP